MEKRNNEKFTDWSPAYHNIVNNAVPKYRREREKVTNETITSYSGALSNDASTDYSLWKATWQKTHKSGSTHQKSDWSKDETNEQKAQKFTSHLQTERR